MNESTKPPTSFWVISVLALIWNGFGVMQYLTLQFLKSDVATEVLEEKEIVIESLPAWVTSAFAIAVWGGLLASILLLARKKWAKTVFVISLLGIIVQESYTLFMSNTIAENGVGALVLPVVILLVGIYLVAYSNKAAAKGWLK